MVTESATPEASRRSASSWFGTTPIVRAAPASLAATSDSEPDLPAPPMTATVGLSAVEPVDTYCPTTRAVSAGAPPGMG
mgnify:CR=1 FL=1